jgi:RimJ/RimL family protein N-acetyltransferase
VPITGPRAVDAWPLFGLAVRTPRLELRYADDGLLRALTSFHSSGVFLAGAEPFDGESSFYHQPPESGRRFLIGEWGARAKTSPDWWHLSFAVLVGGQPIGMQDITGADFPKLRTVNSFSWLGLEHQGHGLGKEMRAAVLHLAFEGLGALRAESDAFDDNVASQGVSRSLGYEPNGSLLAPRPSGPAPMSRFLLTWESWERRRRTDIAIDGLDACRALLGIGPALAGRTLDTNEAPREE